jgi:hypothetical protein
MNGSVLPEQMSAMELRQFESIPEDTEYPNDGHRASENSNVYETIAPARGVAIQQAEYK